MLSIEDYFALRRNAFWNKEVAVVDRLQEVIVAHKLIHVKTAYIDEQATWNGPETEWLKAHGCVRSDVRAITRGLTKAVRRNLERNSVFVGVGHHLDKDNRENDAWKVHWLFTNPDVAILFKLSWR